jgi:hypothetical protein
MDQVTAKVRVVLHGNIEVFKHQIAANPTQADLEAVVDLYEGQVGVVLSIDGPNDERFFKAVVEAWEVM